jgi:hypothetical protein
MWKASTLAGRLAAAQWQQIGRQAIVGSGPCARVGAFVSQLFYLGEDALRTMALTVSAHGKVRSIKP